MRFSKSYNALKSMGADLSKVTVILGGMNMQNKAIQVKGLQKSYKQIHVLKGVDFEVEKAVFSPCSAPMARARRRL
jgi:hypothetical protein